MLDYTIIRLGYLIDRPVFLDAESGIAYEYLYAFAPVGSSDLSVPDIFTRTSDYPDIDDEIGQQIDCYLYSENGPDLASLNKLIYDLTYSDDPKIAKTESQIEFYVEYINRIFSLEDYIVSLNTYSYFEIDQYGGYQCIYDEGGRLTRFEKISLAKFYYSSLCGFCVKVENNDGSSIEVPMGEITQLHCDPV